MEKIKNKTHYPLHHEDMYLHPVFNKTNRCKYCNENPEENECFILEKLELKLAKEDKEWFLNDTCDISYSFGSKIYFCPMCGRKLF